MTTEAMEDTCAGCLVATALCPVAALCGPCLCCAANVAAWRDQKIPWFKHVDSCCQYLIIDQHEIEVFHDVRWICACGHVYYASLDGRGVEFRDLPRDWPCHSCGQTRLDQWICEPAGQIWDSPRYDVGELGSHRFIFDTCTTHFSSAASFGFCSGTFSTTDHSSESSWLEGYTSEDDDVEGEISGEVVGEADSGVACSDWRCEDDHALAWTGEQLWCETCRMSVSWPVWHEAARSVTAQPASQKSAMPWYVPAESDGPTFWTAFAGEIALVPCHESRSLRLIDGQIYRKGLGGHAELPLRPGFQAGGGLSGPWWTATDPKFLGN